MDRGNELGPTLSLLSERLFTPGCQLVVTPPPLAFLLHPAALDPPFFLHAGERRVQGRDAKQKLTAGSRFDELADFVAVALAGFFEYHTSDITLEKLEDLLRDLADGKLSHQQILSEGGHGAFLRRAVSFSAVETIVATGPRRKMLAQSRLPIEFGAPWGDNMMTGTVGLLEAVRRQKGLDPILYL
ncbi:MAG: hypothetical protein JRF38_26850 [Deltaproteobacteria bacterium]|jgi:hypothetical protein|nr:hypothetical protein [Deltaproteobacteria bacterium]